MVRRALLLPLLVHLLGTAERGARQHCHLAAGEPLPAAERRVAIKLTHHQHAVSVNGAQAQVEEHVVTIRGFGGRALARTAGNLVQGMRPPPLDPDAVSCTVVAHLRTQEDDDADARAASAGGAAAGDVDPLSCWRYGPAVDDARTETATTSTAATNTVVFVPHGETELLELHTRLAARRARQDAASGLRSSYPGSQAEWPARFQHLLGPLTQRDDPEALPPQSLWDLPTLLLDAPRAFAVWDFCAWARIYGFETPRRLLMTDPGDPELRCVRRPSESATLFAFDAETGTGDLHRPLPVSARGADLMVVSQTLEHLHAPALALKNMLDALAPGGMLFASVPFTNKLHDGVDVEKQPPFLHHFTHYTPFGLAVAASTVGFDVLELGSWGNRDYVRNVVVDFPGVELWPSPRQIQNLTNDPLAPAQAWILARRPTGT